MWVRVGELGLGDTDHSPRTLGAVRRIICSSCDVSLGAWVGHPRSISALHTDSFAADVYLLSYFALWVEPLDVKPIEQVFTLSVTLARWQET